MPRDGTTALPSQGGRGIGRECACIRTLPPHAEDAVDFDEYWSATAWAERQPAAVVRYGGGADRNLLSVVDGWYS